MIFLNTGIGVIVYGAPVLTILLTLLVSVIEALWLRNYSLKFTTILSKLVVTNLFTTIIGLLFILILNLTEGLRILAEVPEKFNMEKFSGPYLTTLSLLVVVPNYLVTILLEFAILKRYLSNELKLKDVLLANLCSYLVLLLMWLCFLKLT